MPSRPDLHMQVRVVSPWTSFLGEIPKYHALFVPPVPRGVLSRCMASYARVTQLSDHKPKRVWVKRYRQHVTAFTWLESTTTPRHSSCMLVEANSVEQSLDDGLALDLVQFHLERLLANLVTSTSIPGQVRHEVSTITTWPRVVVRQRRCHYSCWWPVYLCDRWKSPGMLLRLPRDNG